MRLRINPELREVRSYGIRTGWWYCIPSAFLQLNVGRRYWSIWAERKNAKRWTPEQLSADRKAEVTDYEAARQAHNVVHTWVDFPDCDKYWCEPFRLAAGTQALPDPPDNGVDATTYYTFDPDGFRHYDTYHGPEGMLLSLVENGVLRPWYRPNFPLSPRPYYLPPEA